MYLDFKTSVKERQLSFVFLALFDLHEVCLNHQVLKPLDVKTKFYNAEVS